MWIYGFFHPSKVSYEIDLELWVKIFGLCHSTPSTHGHCISENRERLKENKIYFWQGVFWSWPLSYNLWSRSLHILYLWALHWWRVSETGSMGKKIFSRQMLVGQTMNGQTETNHSYQFCFLEITTLSKSICMSINVLVHS